MNPKDFTESASESAKSSSYKGHLIVPHTYQLRDSGEWTTCVHIWERVGSSEEVTEYSATNTFPTKDEAVQACIQFGQLIIDGAILPKRRTS